MIYTIEQIRSIAAPIAASYGINSVFLFGSYARGEATDMSDVDLLIEEIRKIIYNALDNYLMNNHYNRGKAKMIIADAVRKFTKVRSNKGPMVLPFILEIE